MKKRKHLLNWSILICTFCSSLFSNAQETRDPSFAVYNISFESIWSQETHPHPSGALHPDSHWSDLVGVTHKNQVTFLEMGAPSTTGVQNVAELGNSNVFFQEAQQAITENTAYNALDFGALNTSAGVIQGEFEVHPDYSFLTVLSMIAPSPDWMIAVNSIPLKDQNDHWREEIVIDLYPYDAGTDSGVDYTSEDEITSPAGVITSLQGIAPFSNQKIGTLTLILNDVLNIQEQEIEEGLTIFPNPSNGIFTIASPNEVIEKLLVYNTLGQQVFQTAINTTRETIDLTRLQSGIYFIQSISSEGIQSTQRIVIR